MSYRVTVRIGAQVEHFSAATIDQGLELLQEHLGPEMTRPSSKPVNLGYRRYEPARQVAARGEIRGPRRWFPEICAGIDVRGDGTSEAWIGRFHRRLVSQQSGEDSHQALRRVITRY